MHAKCMYYCLVNSQTKNIDIDSMTSDELKDTVKTLLKRVEALEADNNWLNSLVALAQKKQYGKQSEKTNSKFEQLELLFNEVERTEEETEAIAEEAAKTEVKGYTRQVKKKETDWEKHVTKVIEHGKQPGNEANQLKVESTYSVYCVPAHIEVIKHMYYSYLVPEESTDEHTVIISPEREKTLIPESVATPELLSYLIVEKYMKAVPLYRMEQEFKQKGIPLTRQNMCNWLMRIAAEIFIPMRSCMLDDLHHEDIGYSDETTLNVLDDKERQNSYIFVYSSSIWSKIQCSTYWYNESRGDSFATKLIGAEYHGYIHSDAYQDYQKIGPDVVNVLCWAHARRYCVQAMETSPIHKRISKVPVAERKKLLEENPGYELMYRLVKEIQKLFEMESEYRKEQLSPEEIYERRQKDHPEVLDTIFGMAADNQSLCLNKSKTGSAITYLLNNEKGLRNYLLDGRLELTDNRSERAVKDFVIGRKNWLFCKSKNGADSSAALYTMAVSAKMNHLNVYEYLNYIMDQVRLTGDHSREFFRTLLPYSDTLPASLKVQSEGKEI